MWFMTAPTTNTCTARAWNKRLLAALLPPLALAACSQDTASYTIADDKQHAIVLIRNQAWFWEDTVALTIAPARLPDCQGSLTVEDVPKGEPIALYRPPDEYAEPIFILKAGARHFAVSTATCRVQEFKAAPAALGTALGAFHDPGEGFRFVAEQTTAAGS